MRRYLKSFRKRHNQGLILLHAAILVLVVCACSRTVTGGYADSSDQLYRLNGRIFGAYGRAFADRTSKTLRIAILPTSNPKKPLFRKSYAVTGGDISFAATWSGHTNLQVEVFEASGSLSNHVLTLKYRFDPGKSRFVEVPIAD